MLAALLLILSVAQAGEDWRELPSPVWDEAYAWRPAADATARGEVRRVVLRAFTPGWGVTDTDAELACGAQTMTVRAVRLLDDEGGEVLNAAVPEDERRAEPLYTDAGVLASLYAEVCPGGAPLAERPAAPGE